MKIFYRLLVTMFCLSITLPAAQAQDPEEQHSQLSNAPPRVLFLVYEDLRPDRVMPYQRAEATIVRSYELHKIPVYWLGLQSVTGSPSALYLDTFESFAEAENNGLVMAKAMAAHPEVAQMQERALESVSAGRTVVAVRRDDLAYRPTVVEFSKARYLRTAILQIKPEEQTAFAEQVRALKEKAEQMNASQPWLLYRVDSGLPGPVFVLIQPMRSLEDADEARTSRRGEIVTRDLERLSGVLSCDSQIYALNPAMSHVSAEFAAVDKEFWHPR